MLGVSDDTLRRWIDDGRLQAVVDDSGRTAVAGSELARRAREIAAESPLRGLDPAPDAQSVRNHFTGIVTAITADTVMAQVELQAGPFRIVSLISAEAVRDMGLEVGSLATAAVKATNVAIERKLP